MCKPGGNFQTNQGSKTANHDEVIAHYFHLTRYYLSKGYMAAEYLYPFEANVLIVA